MGRSKKRDVEKRLKKKRDTLRGRHNANDHGDD